MPRTWWWVFCVAWVFVYDVLTDAKAFLISLVITSVLFGPIFYLRHRRKVQ